MKQKFTPNHLVKFIYKETSAQEMLDIIDALNEDYILAEEYEALIEAYQALPKINKQPSRTSINNILDYSRHSRLQMQF